MKNIIKLYLKVIKTVYKESLFFINLYTVIII